MKKIFGVISALLILCSCGAPPAPQSITGKLEKAWQTGFAAGYKATLIDETLVIPSGQDVIALDVGNGNVIWKYESPRKKVWYSSNCQKFGDTILVCFESGAGSLIVNLTKNGTEIEKFENERQSSMPTISGPRFWQVQTNLMFGNVREFVIEPSLPMIASNSSMIFAVSEANMIRAYDFYGKIVWYKNAIEDVQRISICDNILFVYTNKRLLAFEAQTGKFLWNQDSIVTVDPVPFGKNLLFATDKAVIEVERSKGIIQHSLKKDGVISLDVAPDGIVLLANAKVETYDKSFKLLESVNAFDGTLQVIVGSGMIITNGTVGQTGYKLAKP
ncbi:MAG: PQQ-binding-like beta-propeller repeat protein [Caldiserica bacterium]|nr:PQQ-binding-like beta-propeller repeat protein [Caldisericota bacterium]